MIKELQEKIKKRAVRCEGEEELWSAIDDIVSETALAVITEIENRLKEEDEETIHWCEEGDGLSWAEEKIAKLKQEIKDNA